jgi:hypothetical protein
MDLLAKFNELRPICDPNISDEVVYLALKKNNLDFENSFMLLIDEQ